MKEPVSSNEYNLREVMKLGKDTVLNSKFSQSDETRSVSAEHSEFTGRGLVSFGQ